MTKRALITGITGQDGAYLTKLLLNKGYEVYGLRQQYDTVFWRLKKLNVYDQVKFIIGDLTDQTSLLRALETSDPHEIYNLAAQSVVTTSWKNPVNTSQITALGVVNLLDVILQFNKNIRFFQASSSEMFGKTKAPTQDELTRFHPCSPYAVSKLFGHWITVNYRESFGLHANSGILFNHDSPLRDKIFVSRKISDAIARIILKQQDKLALGNIDVKRDWGFAGDYVEAMWSMLQSDTPDDYVIATGKSLSIREICEKAFSAFDLDYNDYVVIDPEFFRPAESKVSQADPSKIYKQLGWKAKTPFEDVMEMMIQDDLKIVKTEINQLQPL